MTRDDVMRETVKHVRRVASLMLEASHEIERRAVCHDDSKFSPEEFEAMFDRDMARTFTPPADTPQTAPSSPSNGGSSASSTTPATVPVPLELAREWQLTRKQLRSWLRGDCLASRLYDTLAAVVKEAKRGK